ncbi:RING/U-box [Glarea lozoyensis ATCC 20868]|uniref:RING/U-box n=1 Tax=Glarea lozoyensis (strain ATCC 20868 / MF5171) TaxID=1116229 RepID=S3CZJ7_GLAL2|nr:RING/U-box [Glarea lozoyensis ATCC 20868]EPE30299.1 RING/U-box [Glarea lozoyensis ATCC 20868]
MATGSQENYSSLDRTITTNQELGMYELVNTPSIENPDMFSQSRIDATENSKDSECLVCLETYSEQRPMLKLQFCPHKMCKICFIRMTKYQGIQMVDGDKWADCPFCREMLEAELRWTILPTFKLNFYHDFLSGSYSNSLGSNKDGLIGINSDNQGVIVKNTVAVEMRQDGEYTETVWKREMYLRMTSCPDCTNSCANSMNCSTAEATRHSKMVRDFFGFLAGNIPRDSTRRVTRMRQLDIVNDWTPGSRHTEAGEPMLIETWYQHGFQRKMGQTHDPEGPSCSGQPTTTYYEWVRWTTKVRERYYRATLLPVKLYIEQRLEEDIEDDKHLLKVFIEIQKVIAMCCPEVQQLSDLKTFVESKGLRTSNTRLVLDPQKVFPTVVEEPDEDLGFGRNWVRRPRMIVQASAAFLIRQLQNLGARTPEEQNPDTISLDIESCPHQPLTKYVSPWYTQLEDLHRAKFF